MKKTDQLLLIQPIFFYLYHYQRRGCFTITDFLFDIFLPSLYIFSVDQDSAEGKKRYEEQKGRVVALFRRQLRQPLLGMESSLQEYQQFVGEDSVDQNILRDYQKAREKLKAREELGKVPVVCFYSIYPFLFFRFWQWCVACHLRLRQNLNCLVTVPIVANS